MSLSVLSHQQYTNALILCLWVYLTTNNTQKLLATNNTQMPSSYVSVTTNNTQMLSVLSHQQYTNALILCPVYLTTNNTQMPSSYVSECT